MIFFLLIFFYSYILPKPEYDSLIGTISIQQNQNDKANLDRIREIKADLYALTLNELEIDIEPGLKIIPNFLKEHLCKLSKEEWIKKFENSVFQKGFDIPITEWPENQRLILFTLLNHYQFSEYLRMLQSFPEYHKILLKICKDLDNEEYHKKIHELKIKVNGKKLCQFIYDETNNYILKCQKKIFDITQEELNKQSNKLISQSVK